MRPERVNYQENGYNQETRKGRKFLKRNGRKEQKIKRLVKLEKEKQNNRKIMSNNGIKCNKNKTCNYCGRLGHIERECYKKQICNICGKQGHTGRICRKNINNQKIIKENNEENYGR